MSNLKGFSIVEVIVAITIMAVIGVFTSTLLTRTYRSNTDTELISKLKQNGEVASNNIGEAIRMADAIVCYGSNGTRNDRIVIRTVEGNYMLFRFVDPFPLNGTPTQNGYIAKQENLNPASLPNFCIVQPPNFATEIKITDNVSNDITGGVSISNGQFKKLSGPEGKDTVTITFDIGPAGQPAGTAGTINVQTTIQVR